MSDKSNPIQDLGDALATLEVVRDMLGSKDPEIRAYAVSVSLAIRDVLSSIYSEDMDIRFNKDRL
jgi:hypothetical protein